MESRPVLESGRTLASLCPSLGGWGLKVTSLSPPSIF